MAALKLSAAEWCCFRDGMDPAEVYGRLAEAGYVGVEMVPPERHAAARAAGLELVNVCAEGMYEGLNRTENHAKLLPVLRDIIAQAGDCGAKQVIVFSGARDDLDEAVGIANCAAGLAQLVGDAEKAGVVLAFEMLNSVDHGDYHATASSYGYAVTRAVNSPHMRVLYDIYHQQRTGEDLMATLVDNIDLVCHLHVAGSPKRDFPGADQEIDYASLVRAVQSTNYDGYWGMEFVPPDDPVGQLEKAAALFNSYAD